jgi:hypothetical protein
MMHARTHAHTHTHAPTRTHTRMQALKCMDGRVNLPTACGTPTGVCACVCVCVRARARVFACLFVSVYVISARAATGTPNGIRTTESLHLRESMYVHFIVRRACCWSGLLLARFFIGEVRCLSIHYSACPGHVSVSLHPILSSVHECMHACMIIGTDA